jgi:purine-nucleoside phosphorylase
MELDKILQYLRSKFPFLPETAIILGSGLGSFSDHINVEREILYSEIPGFPKSTVKGHKGSLTLGAVGQKPILTFNGRFHYYEGWSMNQVALPARIAALLGCKNLIASNAAGGVNPDFEIGDIMLISDHINLFPNNPLIGENNDEWGTRFPDMSQVYSKEMIALAESIAEEQGTKLQKGVYAGLTGPCLETPAEYKYIRTIGADAVGMSTVPEIIAAHHMGLNCFGLSIITDLGVEGKIVETTHEDVVRRANEAAQKLNPLIKELISRI